ncbi:MAG: MFS transporter [Bacilli bacterium]
MFARLSRPLAAYGAWCLAQGLVLPWVILYLHRTRGIADLWIGAAMAAMSGAGALAIPLAAYLQDHCGHARVLAGTLLLYGVAVAAFGVVRTPATAVMVTAVVGASGAAVWNAFSTHMVTESGHGSASQFFGRAFLLQNAGYGLGALASGFVVRAVPAPFCVLFGVGATISGLWGMAEGIRAFRLRRAPELPPRASGDAPTASRMPMSLWLACWVYGIFALVASGITTVFPLWTTGPVQMPPAMLGWAGGVNAGAVMATYLLLGRRIASGSHLQWIQTSAAGYAVALGAVFAARDVGRIGSINLMLLIGMAVVGGAETLLFSSLPAFVNEIAPPAQRGQYNGAINTVWQAGSIVGPTLAGTLVQQRAWLLMVATIPVWWVPIVGLTRALARRVLSSAPAPGTRLH